MVKLRVQKRMGTIRDQLTLTIENHSFAMDCFSWETDDLVNKLRTFSDAQLIQYFQADTEETIQEW